VVWARLPAEAVGVVRRKVSKDANPTFATGAENHQFFEGATASCLGI
jgi:hypothetical protein